MAAHHVVELVGSGVVCGGRLILWILGEVLADILGEAVRELVKAPFRRKKKQPGQSERAAREPRNNDRDDVLADVRAHTPEPTSPQVMKLPRIPTPPRADRARYLAGHGDGASPPRRRSIGG